jgi:hypothetical protein
MNLLLGAGHLDRVLEDAERLLIGYRNDDGLRYLDYRPATDADRLLPEDLAVTILINSRVGAAAFKSAQDLSPALDLSRLPDVSFEESSAGDRAASARRRAPPAAGLARGVGDRRVQRLAGRVQGAGRRPLVPLQQPLEEPEHPVGRGPLGGRGLVQAQLPAPLHMGSADEPPVRHGQGREAKWEVGRDLDGDPLPGRQPPT